MDVKKDRLHPEKNKRPLARSEIDVWEAFLLIIILFTVSIIFAFSLSFYFLLIILAIFFLTLFYSLFLKNELFVDILIVAINFVLRTIAGAFIATVNNKPLIDISPWLILCPFFLSLFLSVSKRESELVFLGENAKNHRKVLGYYNLKLTNSLMIIFTTLLIISYSLYSFLSKYHLLWTLPVALYIIFRYLYLIYSGNEVARYPEKLYKDIRISLAVLIWIVTILIILY